MFDGHVRTGEPITPSELRRLHVLRRVAPESVHALLRACPVHDLERGETLIEAGQSNLRMYMVLSGRLTVHLPGSGEVVATLEAGEAVGELSVLVDRPACATVRADTGSRVLAVDEESFWRLVGASHEFSVNLLLLLAQRMRNNLQSLQEGAHRRRELERDAWTDALTGLHNRRWLDDRLARLVARHARAATPLSLLVLDIDHFKQFNDLHGHPAGDAVLAGVARTVMTSMRPTDLAARYGGEELVVILPDTPLAGAVVAADRLRRRIAETPIDAPCGGPLPAVTVSVGAAELGAGESMESFFARADAALYKAKRAGRDRVETA
jgi:diguanylate cyclase (GGDEF)-like protein